MALPVVAIVGRPNVGKSSLLNAIARRRISIVEPTAGVTRDRVSAVVELNDRYFELVDTGGYGIEDEADLTEHVREQIGLAIDRADLVLFTVDVCEGITELDRQVAQLLRKCDAKVILAANKADTTRQDRLAGEFFSLGFGEAVCVSAQHGRNLTSLVEEVLARLPDADGERPQDTQMKLAVVGKRNVGKSTFINYLVGEERVIVSELPGTTRDAVDVRFEKDGHSIVAIDTAGVRKKSRMANHAIEFYSYSRATKSIRRADVVLLFLDAIAEFSQVDKRLARYIADEYKPCIIVINKWDLAKDRATTEQYDEYLQKILTHLDYAPVSFITAKSGRGVGRLLDLAQGLHRQAKTTVGTAALNKAIRTVVDERAPSARHKVGLPKIYYATQVGVEPPTLLLFVNDPAKIDENYQRYMVNRLRELLPFAEVPIRLLLRGHREQQGGMG